MENKGYFIDVMSNGHLLETSGPMDTVAVAQSISGLTSDYFYNPDATFIIRVSDETKAERLAMRLENNRKALETPAKIARINAYGKIEMEGLPKLLA